MGLKLRSTCTSKTNKPTDLSDRFHVNGSFGNTDWSKYNKKCVRVSIASFRLDKLGVIPGTITFF